MKRFALSLMLLAAGCASSHELQWTKIPVSAKTIGELEQTGGEVTLANGDVVLLVTPRNFGDALCDRFACVRKSEIVGIRDWDYSSNDIEGPLGLIAAPLTIPVWLLLWAGQASYESHGRGSVSNAPPAPAASTPAPQLPPPPPPPPPPVIPEETLWLQTGLKAPSQSYRNVTPSNPCASILPKSLTTDEEALNWVYDNRLAVKSWICLISAEEAMDKLDAPDLTERRFRMRVLIEVRHQWWNAHCSREITRVVPSSKYTRTTFSPFALIAETLADEASYVLPDEPCPNWAPASTNPPDRVAFMAAIDPFSRVNAAPWIHNRTMDDNGSENVSW